MSPKSVQRLAQAILRALWVGVIPALLAAVATKYLVPPDGPGLPGFVAKLERGFPAVLLAALFLGLSAVARYWRYRVPGGRYALALDPSVAPDERDPEKLREWESFAALRGALDRPRARQGWARADPAWQAETEARLAELGKALKASDLGAARLAAAALEPVAAPVLGASRRRDAAATIVTVAVAGIAAWAVRANVVEGYRVLSSSMLPTLEPDDRIVGKRVHYGADPADTPSRGDVVVFRSATVPSGRTGLPDVLVKRVIGLPGDTIAMHGSTPVINGWEVPTCRAGRYLYVLPDGEGGTLQGWVVVEYLDDRAYLTVHMVPPVPFPEPYVVKPGEVFVLGDNRGNSMNSRTYSQGRGAGVPLAGIEAQARWFLAGTHRSGDTDWSRLFKPVGRLEGALHAEGINAQDLETGIQRCFKQRPAQTHPPAPGTPVNQDTKT